MVKRQCARPVHALYQGHYASDMGHGHILDSYALLFGIWRHISRRYPFTLSGVLGHGIPHGHVQRPVPQHSRMRSLPALMVVPHWFICGPSLAGQLPF